MSDIETENIISKVQVDELKEENKKLKDCVKFYANKYNWVGMGVNENARCIFRPPSDNEYDETDKYYPNSFWCGKLARQVLREVGDK